MCGRTSQFYTWADVHAFSSLLPARAPTNLPPRYNLSPTDPIGVITVGNDGAWNDQACASGRLPKGAFPPDSCHYVISGLRRAKIEIQHLASSINEFAIRAINIKSIAKGTVTLREFRKGLDNTLGENVDRY
jgi:hypothetical protein